MWPDNLISSQLSLNLINHLKHTITMELKNFFTDSSNTIYNDNMDLLEEYGLVNPLGSPNKLFLKFLKSKKIKIKKDKITRQLIDEFEESIDSINLKITKNQRQKEIIFTQRKVWINIVQNDELVGCDLYLESDRMIVGLTGQVVKYSDILDIEISEGSWSKNKMCIITSDDEISFEINEARAQPLKEILEDNITHQKHDEIDDLMDLYELYGEGLISEDELEVRKAIIYADELYCTNCGHKLEKDSEFCTNCGHKVDE